MRHDPRVLLYLALLLVGLLVLVPAADIFVTAAGRLALTLRISPVIVGVVVIGFGTSTPELLVAGLASARGEAELAAGSIVGSNVANLALIAPIAALVLPFAVSSKTLRREAPLSTAAVVLFALTLLVGLERPAGIMLLVAGVAATVLLIRAAAAAPDEIGDETEEAYGTGATWLRVALGLAGTLGGAQLVVQGASGIATEAGISQGFIGLTLVAVGTSLPELVTAVQGVRRGHPDLVVGNILGSNLFNSLIAGGLIGVIAPGHLDGPEVAPLALIAMLTSAGLAWFLLATGRRLVRWEAAVLLVAYAAVLPFLAE
jgi:cation:H+ antiporter